MAVLFIADRLAPATATTPSSVRPSGTELTDAAAIEGCPEPIEATTFAQLDVDMLDRFELIVVSTSRTAKRKQLRAISERGRHLTFEHDMRICRYGGNFVEALEPVHRSTHTCVCPHPGYQRFYERARGTVFLTARQKLAFEANPFFAGTRSAILGTSLFNQEFLRRARSRSAAARRDTAVVASQKRSKGYAQALEQAVQSGATPVVIDGLTPAEVFDTFERVERFVYLPTSIQAAGRMAIEARLLGCEVTANDNVGVTTEPWWSWPDQDALAYVGSGVERFWRLAFSR